MLGFEQCDFCKSVRYTKDGGSTYCGRRNGVCKFEPKVERTKVCSDCARVMPEHWDRCPWCGYRFCVSNEN